MALSPISGANLYKFLASGNAIAVQGATVTIRNDLGQLKSLYEDKDGLVPKLNPFVADNTGQWTVYTSPSEVVISIKKGTSQATLRDKLTFSPEAAIGVGTPIAQRTPNYVGERYHQQDTNPVTIFEAVGNSSNDWVQLN